MQPVGEWWRQVDAIAAGAAVVASATTFWFTNSVAKPFPPGSRVAGHDKPTLLKRLMNGAYYHMFEEAFGYQLEWAERFGMGNNYWLRTFYMQRLVITDPDDLQCVFDSETEFGKGSVYKVMTLVLGQGLVTILDDSTHAHQRRLCNPSFSSAAVRHIASTTMSAHVGTMIGTIHKLIAEQQSGGGPAKIALRDAVNRTALNVIAESAFHADAAAVDDVAHNFVEITRNGFNMTQLLPFVKSLPTSRNLKLAKARSNIYGYSERGAAATRKELGNLSPEERVAFVEEGRGLALLDYLLLAPDMSKQQLADHCVTFMFAGHETSANTLNWLTILLAHHPEVQKKLHEELCDVLALGAAPTGTEQLQSCTYLSAVIKETLRLFPVAPAVSRQARVDTVLPATKTFIPAGTDFILGILHQHRDRRVWGDDAAIFRPDRWEGAEGAALEARLKPCHYMPFSVGKRNCIGKEFALKEMELITAALVRNFSFGWPEGTPFPVRKFLITMQTDKTYPLLVEAREE